MNWDAIAAIGQAVSALALVLVLFQVRQAREETLRSVGQARLFGSRDLFLTTATNKELASALARLRARPAGERQQQRRADGNAQSGTECGTAVEAPGTAHSPSARARFSASMA